MSQKWITDREPTAQDSDIMGQVWVTSDDGKVNRQWWTTVSKQPWMPIVQPEPYVKPKQYVVKEYSDTRHYAVEQTDGRRVSMYIPTREAAERIAAIYEEEML